MTADGHMTIWMRLRNSREVIAGLRQTATATGMLGSSVDRLARHMDRAGRRTFMMNQALFTMRRYSYMLTLAVTASAAAIFKWGFDYNSQVQEARIAFAKFGLTHKQVNKEIRDLYQLAAISPFLFTDITRTARRFMAFGMTVEMANESTRRLVDALVTFGVPTGAALNRASMAMAHLMSIGRLTGQVVYQLARDNVPIIQALEKELHLTGEQLRHVGTLGIPAATAINALNKYISETPKFHNAAMIFATRTWRGIVTTTRDYIAQFMGQVEKPLFNNLQRGARRFMFWLIGAGQKGFNKGGITGMLGTFSPGLAMFWKEFAADLRAVWRIFVDGIIPAFISVAHIVGPPLFILFWGISKALQFLGRHTLLAKIFFGLLAAEVGILALRYLFLLPLQTAILGKMIIMNTLQRIAVALGLVRIVTINLETGAIITQDAVKTKSILVTTRLSRALLFQNAVGLKLTRMWKLLTTGMILSDGVNSYLAKSWEGRALRMRIAILRLRAAFVRYAIAVRAASVAMVSFLFTNPIGWAILLAAALGILYWKWDRFRRAVNRFAKWLVTSSGQMADAVRVGLLGPFGVALTILHRIRSTWEAIMNIKSGKTPGGHGWSWGGALRGAGRSVMPFGLGGLVGLAGGGTVSGAGAFVVGEHGREVVNLPRGTAVRPVGRVSGVSGVDLSGIVIELHSKTVLEADGRQLAEVVSKHRLDGNARR